MDNVQIIIIVIGVLITFFGFIGALLIGAVGYFLRSFHAEYKINIAKTEFKEEKLDERMQKMTDNFGLKLEVLMEKFAEKINELPKGSDNLSQVMLQHERDVQKRMDEHSQRIQNNYNRIETVADRLHGFINEGTGQDLQKQILKRRAEKLAESSSTL